MRRGIAGKIRLDLDDASGRHAAAEMRDENLSNEITRERYGAKRQLRANDPDASTRLRRARPLRARDSRGRRAAARR